MSTAPVRLRLLPARTGPALLLGLAMLATWAAVPPAQAERPRDEYEVKAAFLYSFAHFVTWPDAIAARDTIVIGIVGTDPFGRVIDRLFAGKAPAGRPIVIRRFSSFDDVSDCQILFVGATGKKPLAGGLKKLRSKPVLTVGEQEDFATAGGIIRLKTVGDRVRFDINVVAADSAHLKLSSSLLRVADSVLGQEPGGGTR
jgi:hypothetical protein